MAQTRKRRRLDPTDTLAEQFQSLRQIPNLKIEDCRAVVELLNQNQEKTGRRVASRPKQKYPNACVAVGQSLKIDSVQFPCLDISKVVQNKVSCCNFFKDCLRDALQLNNNELDIVVFWDESVPGNVLAPDLRRKAALTYFSFLQLPVLWADTSWMTLAVCRSQALQSLPEGHVRYITKIFETLVRDTKDGFMVDFGEQPILIRIRRVVFLADADGLRLGLGNKGAAGLKPCFRCANVVSGKHTALRNHYHISSALADHWSQHSTEQIRGIHAHLASLRVKARREEAEKLLGWRLSAMQFNCFLSPALVDVMDITDILYDPMHCFASNGICCQELGLWFEAVQKKTNKQIDLNRFVQYATNCWTSLGPHMCKVNIANLLSSKNWHDGKDFRGDATDALSVLPLCIAFSLEIILPVYPNLQPEIDCLKLLYVVIQFWQKIKRKFDLSATHQLARVQKRHAEAFVSVYGPEEARPKLHFSLHMVVYTPAW
eukprot:Skav206835  [mRNA]  locus=scaffold637:19263:20726:+ [translate_table: standard]